MSKRGERYQSIFKKPLRKILAKAERLEGKREIVRILTNKES